MQEASFVPVFDEIKIAWKRHTCATMMLTLGVDIYTVSKLLGHRRVTTTQIYGNIVDKKKREAVDMIPDFMQ